jgi:hypothetical protein
LMVPLKQRGGNGGARYVGDKLCSGVCGAVIAALPPLQNFACGYADPFTVRPTPACPPHWLALASVYVLRSERKSHQKLSECV